MSKRNRPTTAAQAAHRSLRHAYRSAYNSPEGKAARAAAAKAAPAAKPAAAKPAAVKKAASPAPTKTTT
jgi:multifunctional 2-oxoglutarate metabolism enzyme